MKRNPMQHLFHSCVSPLAHNVQRHHADARLSLIHSTT